MEVKTNTVSFGEFYTGFLLGICQSSSPITLNSIRIIKKTDSFVILITQDLQVGHWNCSLHSCFCWACCCCCCCRRIYKHTRV